MRPLTVTVVAALLLATAGCATEQRAPGCAPPPNEDRLLAEYASDPVLAVKPDGATQVGQAHRSKACVQLSREDVSATSVTLRFQSSRDYDAAALRRTYEPAAQKKGWLADKPPPGPEPPPGDVYLQYCRRVENVTSVLVVHSQPVRRTDVRPSGPDRPASPVWHEEPGGIYLTITAEPARPSCQTTTP
ncbi:hypothetical protein [Dactylosporangium sp. CA-092794]|uniref:hypothetical protein n=1 Tax=Dactylosporangium sp. CA-092794 TaxID=3239929 RepID=UPI003D8A7804